MASRNYTRGIVVAILLVLGIGLSLECLARLGFRRISRIGSRITVEYQRARAVGRGTSSRPTVLVVGNSLLLQGVEVEALQRMLPAEVRRFAIENTTYLDWYYGLRRLFEEGARPDQVWLFLNIPQLVGNSILGEYGAFYLYRPGDIPRVSQLAGYDLTKASGLVLGEFSLYYAARNEIRNYLLNHLYPSYASVLHDLEVVKAPTEPDATILQIGSGRLSRLQALCSQYGARFRFILPPGFGTGDATLLEAAKRSHTTVFIPVKLNEYGHDLFQDGFHLNSRGAAQFTSALATTLRRDCCATSAANYPAVSGGTPTAGPPRAPRGRPILSAAAKTGSSVERDRKYPAERVPAK
jgi:hypothetical protein